MPFEICALICTEEAIAVDKWTSSTCKAYHDALLSALRLVYPSKIESWYDKPFLKSPTGTRKYWVRVLNRRAEIWQAAADKKAAAPLYQEPLKDRIRRKIAERKSARINSLSVSFKKSTPKKSALTSEHKRRSGLSSDSDEAAAAVIDLSQSPATSSTSPPSCSSSASTTSSDSPPKAAPHPK